MPKPWEASDNLSLADRVPGGIPSPRSARRNQDLQPSRRGQDAGSKNPTGFSYTSANSNS